MYLCVTRERVVNLVLAFDYLIFYDSVPRSLAYVQLSAFKRQSTAEHGEQNHTQGPHIEWRTYRRTEVGNRG